jgi:hypothetical protein
VDLLIAVALASVVALAFLVVIREGDLLLSLQLSLSLFLFVILSAAKNPCISRGERSDPSAFPKNKKGAEP